MDSINLVRLLRLASPALPVGAFAYSQGLEWAVEAGWVRDAATFADWVRGLLLESLASLDLPALGYSCERQVAGERATHVFLRRNAP